MLLIQTYARVLGQLASKKYLAIALVLANFALAAAHYGEQVLFGKIIDALSKFRPADGAAAFAALAQLIGYWVVLGLFTIGAGVLVALNADKLAHQSRLSAMAKYFEHVLALPLAFHLQTHSGRVLKVMIEGTSAMSWIWLGFFRDHCAALISLTILLPVTLLLNWRLGLLLVCLVFLFGALTLLVVRRTEKLQSRVTGYHTALAEHTSDALGNVPVIQSFTRVETELSNLKHIIHQLLEAQIPVLSWWAIAAVATRAAATLTVTAILLTGTWLYTQGLATIGDIVTFMGFATMLIGKLEYAVGFINTLLFEAPKMREYFQILDETPSVRDKPGAIEAGRLKGAVVFDNVSFSYDGKRAAVADVSFEAKPGETIALVGATGSGKSTTLGLMHRAFDPQSGRIVVDGTDIRDLSLLSLRKNIAVVFQEPMLFARSIRENLIVGRPDATEAEMMDALERAQALEFIGRQSEGLDTIVGERGRTLSGGERQRLSIARALLKNPPILILDEATSALDASTEQKVKLALDEVMKGRTTFVIAHRLATIRNATRILVFEKGRVVESGSFDELVAKGGRFAELAKAQFMVSEG